MVIWKLKEILVCLLNSTQLIGLSNYQFRHFTFYVSQYKATPQYNNKSCMGKYI